jgi:hypothetical protein
MKQINQRWKTILGGVVLAGILLGAGAVSQAAVISALGADANRGETWRSTSDPKPALFDPNGDNAYGSDGYIIYGTSPNFGGSVQYALPGYIGSVFTASGLTPNNSVAYAPLDDPSNPISATVPNLTLTGLRYEASGTPLAYRDYLTFVLATDQTFVLSVIMDTSSGDEALGARVTGPGGVFAVQAAPALNGIPDYLFFQVSGLAGDAITLALQNNAGGTSYLSGVGFEMLAPEPSIGLLLLTGCGLWRWKRAAKARGDSATVV